MGNARLGIDIGGTGIKAALVDLGPGSLIGERVRVETPDPSTPEAVADAVAGLVNGFDYEGPIGIGFPSLVIDRVARTANNIDSSWIGVDVPQLFGQATGRKTAVINDADAAALAEARYGAGSGLRGLVIVLTFGSGIGSGFLVDGELVPNVELGQLELDGHRPAETFFSARARQLESLSWEAWGRRANRFLGHVNAVYSPTLIAVSGGAARKWDKWSGMVDKALPVVRATLANNAGVVGAATLVA